MRMDTLDAIFRHAVRSHADRVAIDVPPRDGRPRTCLTYRQLDARADAIAAALPATGDGGEQPIALVMLPRDCADVYASQLAAARSGCAFCCVDAAFPDRHIRSVIDDARPVAVLTDRAGAARLRRLAGERTVIDVGDVGDAPGVAAPASGGRVARAARPHDLAYLIYTSGTTGLPKGVMIEHAGIASLVRSDAARFGLGPGDRVAQCSSNAYDSSVEETWLAFGVGATLVPVDDERVRSGPDLVPWLKAERISAFCPPPTLLRAMGVEDPARELPDLRLLYVGGEALPQDLSDRWSAHLRLENGYGPTECTVTVVRGTMRPGVPVHIGTAVEGNEAFVMDEEGIPVPDGAEGELWIRGIGLARGYRHRPEATAERFIEHPALGRLYRTGDRVRRRPDGMLEYLGRIDGQVKLRGYRIELAAVEACLAQHPSVTQAACAVVGSGPTAQLGACVVRRAGAPATDDLAHELRAWVRERLPAYMAPARVRWTDAVPTLVSGKVDRRAAAALLADGAPAEDDGASDRFDAMCADPSLPARERICAAFAGALGMQELPDADAHFFTDLGGDSLRAVDCVLRLRRGYGGQGGVRDLYAHPTATALAGVIAATEVRPPALAAAPPHARRTPGAGTVAAAACGQAAVVAAGFVITGASAYAVLFHGLPALVNAVSLRHAVWVAPLALLGLACLWFPLSVLLTAAAKRVLIGRYEPGTVDAWSSRYVREWIVEQVASSIPWALIEGTELVPWTYRMLGARVGRRVHIHRGVNMRRGGWDLLEIGDGATVAQDAAILTSHLHAGEVIHGAVRIGARAHVGVRATLEPGTSLGDGSAIDALGVLPSGCSVPDGERWSGVPAAPAGACVPLPAHEDRACRPADPWTWTAAFFAVRLATTAVALAPAVAIGWLAASSADVDLAAWCAQPRLSAPLVFLACAWSAASVAAGLLLSAILMRLSGGVRPGTHPRYGFTYLRIWLRTGIVESAGRWLSGTLFWPLWLRVAGMRIGRASEVSTIIDVLPETVTVGRECFFADGIYFCSPHVQDGQVHVARTELGDGTFLGNHCVIPAGHTYPEGMFVGIATVAPESAGPGQGWFGIPPMLLHRRDVVDADRRLTFEPGAMQRLSRWSWESARCLVAVPALLAGLGWLAAVQHAHGTASPWACALGWAPLASAGAWLALVAFGIAAKWVLLGRVRPGQHGLWSCWCSRWDYLYVLWWFSARPALARVEGTPFLAMALRAAGTRIGRNVLIGPGATQIVDPDMLSFGDGATVACHFQAHSFEDRILKVDHVRLEPGSSAAENAVVFYGARIERDATLDSGSVLMKRGVVPAGTVARGAPVG
jgi:non-ribosomal peptide synthetase-like protein